MATLEDIQEKISNIVDESPDAPTAGGTGWDLRLDLINRAQRTFAETYDWQVLYKEHNTLTSQSTGNASVPLPGDFRKLASFPVVSRSSNDTDDLPEIRPQEKENYAYTEDYVMVLGNNRDGYTMYVNPPSLASGASIFIPYYATAPSLVSPSDVTVVPNDEYLVQRTIAWIWESRGDERFPNAQAEADRILANMLEQENVKGESYYDNVKNFQHRRKNFRIGRDG